MNLTGELSNTAPSCLGLVVHMLRAHPHITIIYKLYKLAILYHYIKYMSIIYTIIGSISCIYGFYIYIRHIIIYKQKSDYKSRFPVVLIIFTITFYNFFHFFRSEATAEHIRHIVKICLANLIARFVAQLQPVQIISNRFVEFPELIAAPSRDLVDIVHRHFFVFHTFHHSPSGVLSFFV